MANAVFVLCFVAKHVILLILAVRSRQVQHIPIHGNLIGVDFGDEDKDAPIVLLDLLYFIQSLLDLVSNPVVDGFHPLLWLILFFTSRTDVV